MSRETKFPRCADIKSLFLLFDTVACALEWIREIRLWQIIKRSEAVLARVSERRLLRERFAIGEASTKYHRNRGGLAGSNPHRVPLAHDEWVDGRTEATKKKNLNRSVLREFRAMREYPCALPLVSELPDGYGTDANPHRVPLGRGEWVR